MVMTEKLPERQITDACRMPACNSCLLNPIRKGRLHSSSFTVVFQEHHRGRKYLLYLTCCPVLAVGVLCQCDRWGQRTYKHSCICEGVFARRVYGALPVIHLPTLFHVLVQDYISAGLLGFFDRLCADRLSRKLSRRRNEGHQRPSGGGFCSLGGHRRCQQPSVAARCWSLPCRVRHGVVISQCRLLTFGRLSLRGVLEPVDTPNVF